VQRLGIAMGERAGVVDCGVERFSGHQEKC
jgi:hypothetical protein